MRVGVGGEGGGWKGVQGVKNKGRGEHKLM